MDKVALYCFSLLCIPGLLTFICADYRKYLLRNLQAFRRHDASHSIYCFRQIVIYYIIIVFTDKFDLIDRFGKPAFYFLPGLSATALKPLSENCQARRQFEDQHCLRHSRLDLKTALDSGGLREKGMHSVIDGQADALIFPDIVAGNVFYKTITLFGYAKTAGVLQGTQCCCVLPSRADSPDSKYYSLALAAI